MIITTMLSISSKCVIERDKFPDNKQITRYINIYEIIDMLVFLINRVLGLVTLCPHKSNFRPKENTDEGGNLVIQNKPIVKICHCHAKKLTKP